MPKDRKITKPNRTKPPRQDNPKKPISLLKAVPKNDESKKTVKKPTKSIKSIKSILSTKKSKQHPRAVKPDSPRKPLIAAKAHNAPRQPVALASLHDCYLHTHLKKLSRRAQLRRAGAGTLRILHHHTTLRVFDEICRACNAIAKYKRKKTITRALLLESCSAIGLAIAH